MTGSFLSVSFHNEHTHRAMHIPSDYIAYDPSENSVIVAHRGTDTKKMYANPIYIMFGWC